MDIEVVKQRVKEIRKLAKTDYEAAKTAEHQLHHEVLKAISKECYLVVYEYAELATEALKTKLKPKE